MGKQGGGPQMPQEEIDRLLVQYGTGGRGRAPQGRRPVRVRARRRGGARAARGGDPVRGRAGRHRGDRRTRLRGHPGHAPRAGRRRRVRHRPRGPGKPETALDWPALAAFPGTLVFYMGVKALPRIAERLVAGGRARDEPVAVVERGTLPARRPCVSTLGRDRAGRGGHPARRRSRSSAMSPALREQIAWLESRPLFGRTVAVTRAARRPARSRRGCASWARRRRGARDPDRPLDV